MARSLEFTFKGKTFSREIEKLDRTKLYGSVVVETVNADGALCKLSTLASDGRRPASRLRPKLSKKCRSRHSSITPSDFVIGSMTATPCQSH